MILKHKKIIIGGVIAAVTVGTLTGILVPILSKDSKTDAKKELTGYEALVAKIVAAEDEQTAKDLTMKLYGLEVKNDEAIETLETDEKKQYDAAIALGKYIYANKDEYTISVYEGEEANVLKQLLLVFKLKTTTGESTSDAENWPINKIDAEQDEFAFLHTIFKDKFVSEKFNVEKQAAALDGFGDDFKTKEYQMLELFFAFKVETSIKSNFAKYNSASDDDNNSVAIATIKKYIISLMELA